MKQEERYFELFSAACDAMVDGPQTETVDNVTVIVNKAYDLYPDFIHQDEETGEYQEVNQEVMRYAFLNGWAWSESFNV